jgi:hypothetical protein
LQLMLDWQVPHSAANGGLFRPPLRFNACDDMLGLGAQRVALPLTWAQLGDLKLCLQIDGATPLAWRLGDATRTPRQLLADVSGFMAFQPLDALLLGQLCDPATGAPPVVQAGSRVRLWCEGQPQLGEVSQTLGGA